MANDFIRGIKVYLDSAQYGKGMTEMTKKLKEYKQQYVDLQASGKGTTAAFQKLEGQITRTQRAIDVQNQAMQETKACLQNLSGASYKQLVAAQKEVSMQLKTMSPGTREYNELLKTQILLNTRLKTVEQELAQTESTRTGVLAKLSSKLNKYFLVLSTTIAGVTAAVTAGRKAVTAYMEVEEHLANIRKYAGLSSEEVHQLSKELMEVSRIDTRTAHTKLLEIAADAGRLGIKGVENLKAFTVAADKINLSLGSDLGEDAVTNIGKLAMLMGEDKRLGLEEAMLATGSAVTKLAKSSTACEPYLVNFASRLGGIGASSGMSTADILGLGSALDQTMQKVEMSSTALSTLIVKLAKEPQKFAQLAGIEVERFKNLVAVDINEALVQFLEGMKRVGNFQELVPMFDSMEMSGKRAVQVLTTLSEHTNEIREAQNIANEAYERNVEVMTEFNLMNTTSQANLERAKNNLQALRVELGEKLQPILKHVYTTGSIILRTLKLTIDFLSKNKGLILAATAGIVTANRRLLLIRATLLLTGTSMKKFNAEFASFQLLADANGRKVTDLQYAFYRFGNSVKTLPSKLAGLAKSAILSPAFWVAAGVAVTTFVVKVKKSFEDLGKSKAIDYFKQMNQSVYNSLKDHETLIRPLIAVLDDQNATYEERFLALSKLQGISPEFFGNLDLETAKTVKLNQALKQYLAYRQAQVKLDELQATKQNIQTKLEELQNNPTKNKFAWAQKAWMYISDLPYYIASTSYSPTTNKTTQTHSPRFVQRMFDINNPDWKTIDEYANQMTKCDEESEKILQNLLKMESEAPNALDLLTGGGLGDTDNLSEWEKLKELYEGDDGILTHLKEKYEKDADALERSLARKKITQQHYNIYMANLDRQFHTDMGNNLKQYYKEAKAIEFDKESQKNTQVNRIYKMKEKEFQASADARIKIEEQMYKSLEEMEKTRDMNKKIDDTEKLLYEFGAKKDALRAEYEAVLDAIDKMYTTEKQKQDAIANANVIYNSALSSLNQWYNNELRETIEKTNNKAFQDERKALRDQDKWQSKLIGESIKSKYDLELKELELYHKYGRISEETYQQARKEIAIRKTMETYDQIYSYANNAVQNLQKAELALTEAKYEVLLRDAENSGEDTTAIETEYANKKLEIQKKYALSNFSLKLMQITADTAVAIMKALGELGPISGPVAAGLIGITGAAQYAAAFAEYSKVKNLSFQTNPDSTLNTSSVSSMSSSQMSERVVNQYASGNYSAIGATDGRSYDSLPYLGSNFTGLVRRPALVGESGGELIISADDLSRLRHNVNYPLILDAISSSHRGKVIQHASGNISGTRYAGDSTDMVSLLQQLVALVQTLPTEHRAYVLLNDLDKAQLKRHNAQSSFTRSDKNS